MNDGSLYKWWVVTPTRTGSTLLVNIVHGFFDPDKPVWMGGLNTPKKLMKILKSHDTRLFHQEKYTKTPYDLKENCVKIISVERPEIQKILKYSADGVDIVPPDEFSKVKKLDHVLVLDYTNDLLYKSDYSPYAEKNLIDIIKNIAEKIELKFKISISEYQIQNAINRVIKMNEKYENIKNSDFEYCDKFYHIHGGHRNRK